MNSNQWTTERAQKAAKKLGFNELIEFTNFDFPESLGILDEHLFASRKDIRLSISPHTEYNSGCTPINDDFINALSRMKNLRRLLIIASNQNLLPLASLSSLTELHVSLRGKGEVAIDFISGMEKLEKLEFDSMIIIRGEKRGHIKSCEPLGKCKSLKNLSVYQVGKLDFGFAKELAIENVILYGVSGYKNEQCLFSEHLKSLRLTNMPKVEDLAAMSVCKNLEYLTLELSKNITSLSGVNVSSLKGITVSDMKGLSDFSALKQAVNLTTAKLSFLSSQADAKELFEIFTSLPSLSRLTVGAFWSSRQYDTLCKLFEASDKKELLIKT